jgi:5'-nucleotidase
MIRKTAILVMTFFVAQSPWHQNLFAQTKLHIFSSVNLMGYLETCSCGKNPSGSLTRRATYIKEHRSELEQVLILDSGDFSSIYDPMSEFKTKYLLQALSVLKYDAINLGERDFIAGPQFLLDCKKQFKLPIISANIFYADSVTNFTEPYLLKKLKTKVKGSQKVSGLTVGIFGLIMDRSDVVSEATQDEHLKLITKDPFVVAAELVPKLRKKCDFVIALAHLSSDEITELVSKVPGIDVVLGSHDYYQNSEAVEINNSILMQVGSKGQCIGDLVVNLSKGNKRAEYSGQIISLNSDIKDDSDFNVFLNKYKEDYKQFTQKNQSSFNAH